MSDRIQIALLIASVIAGLSGWAAIFAWWFRERSKTVRAIKELRKTNSRLQKTVMFTLDRWRDQLGRNSHVFGWIGPGIAPRLDEEPQSATAEKIGHEGETTAVEAKQNRAGGGLALHLRNGPMLVGRHLEFALKDGIGPHQTHVIALAGVAQPEVYPGRSTAKKPRRRLHACHLKATSCFDLHRKSHGGRLDPTGLLLAGFDREHLDPTSRVG